MTTQEDIKNSGKEPGGGVNNMLRETKFFECDNTDDLLDALNFFRARTDGGRTEIALTGEVYCLGEPLLFGLDSRISIDFSNYVIRCDGDGLIIKRFSSTEDLWKQ